MEASILDDSSAINDSVNDYGRDGGLDQQDGDHGTGMDRVLSNSALGTGYMGPSQHPNLQEELEAVDSGQVCLYQG